MFHKFALGCKICNLRFIYDIGEYFKNIISLDFISEFFFNRVIKISNTDRDKF